MKAENRLPHERRRRDRRLRAAATARGLLPERWSAKRAVGRPPPAWDFIRDLTPGALRRFFAANTANGATILTDGLSSYNGKEGRGEDLPIMVGVVAPHRLLQWIHPSSPIRASAEGDGASEGAEPEMPPPTRSRRRPEGPAGSPGTRVCTREASRTLVQKPQMNADEFTHLLVGARPATMPRIVCSSTAARSDRLLSPRR